MTYEDIINEFYFDSWMNSIIPKACFDLNNRFIKVNKAWEAMLGYSSGPAAARATMSDAMSGAESRYNQNRKFEQEFLEYMRNKSGAAPRREPGMRLEQTPEGQLTQAEIAARRSMGL